MKKSFKLIICFVCSLTLILTTFFLNFADIKSAKAEENNNLVKLDNYLKKLKAEAPVPGISVVVVKGDRIIYSKGFGEEIIGLNKPMTENTSTAIGSLTKSFTAMAVMQLVEQGKINLDDPVIKYIPEFRTLDKEKSDKITVRMLLSHTSGIPSMDRWINIPETSADAMEKGVMELSSFPLNRDPGENYEYSNEGFDTAGLIIERVSGMKYPEYIEKNILEPLKMTRSTTDINKFNELNVLYGHNPGIEEAIPAGHFVNTSTLAAGSELRCSAENLGHYLIALLNEGKYEGNSVLSKDSIDKLWTPQASFPGGSVKGMADDGVVNYGLGWMSSIIDGRYIVHHGGNTGSASSYTMIYPEKNLAVSILYNISSLDPYKYISMNSAANNILHIVSGETINDSILVNEKDPEQNSYELPSEQNGAYVGEYVSAAGDYRFEVSEDKDGRLAAKMKNSWGTSEFILDFASPSTVYFRNISATHSGQFKIASDGRVTGIEVNGLGSLSRLNENMYANYNEVKSADNKISFYIPREYTIKWDNNKCLIESPDKKIVIQGEIKDKELNGFNDFIKGAADAEIVKENLEHSENIAGHLYREKSSIIKKGNDVFLRMLIYTEIEDRSISFSTDLPYSESGEIIRDMILPVMYSLNMK